MMAISFIPSSRPTATPTIAGLTGTDSVPTGFADLLFSHLENPAITAATQPGNPTIATATQPGNPTIATATQPGNPTIATATQLGNPTIATAAQPGNPTIATATQPGNPTIATAAQPGNPTIATATQPGNPTIATATQPGNPSIATATQPGNPSIATATQPGNPSIATAPQPSNPTIATTTQPGNPTITTATQPGNPTITTATQPETHIVATDTQPSSSTITASPQLGNPASTATTQSGVSTVAAGARSGNPTISTCLGNSAVGSDTRPDSEIDRAKSETKNEHSAESDTPSTDLSQLLLMVNPTIQQSQLSPTPGRKSTTTEASTQARQITESVSDVLPKTTNAMQGTSSGTALASNTDNDGAFHTNFANVQGRQTASAETATPALSGTTPSPPENNIAKTVASNASPFAQTSANSPAAPSQEEKQSNITPPSLLTTREVPIPSTKPQDSSGPAANIAVESSAVESSSTPSSQESPPLIAGIAQATPKPEAPSQVRSEVSTPLSSNAWTHDFSNKVVWLAKNDLQQAQININPPQLGPIQITLNVSGDQASAVFSSPHAEVRQIIENSLPQLKEMLSGAGINLGQADVGANHPQQNRETPYQSMNGNRLANENAILPGDANVGNSKIVTPLQRGRGLVDLFA